MSDPGVERQIERSHERLAQLRERAEREGLGPESAVHEAVEELGQTLEELSISLEELASANDELAEAQVAAEAHARRYLDLFRFAPDAYVVTDGRGVIREVNAVAEEQLGRPSRYLAGKPILPLVAEEDRGAFLTCLTALRERRARLEGRLLRFGSRPGFDASVSAVPELRDGELEIRWALRDVTDRRRAERAALDAEARMRAVLDADQDGIVQIDEKGTILMVNLAVTHMLGYEEGELLGRDVSMLMPSPHRERHGAYLERYLRTGEAHVIGAGRELEAVHRDGTRVPIHISVRVARGESPTFVGVVRDLSGERALQRRLRDAAAAAAVAEEHERRRLAEDLHDDVGQLLTLAGMKLGMLSEAAPESELGGVLGELRELLERAHRHTESLSFQLSPPILHDVGVAAAMEWLADDLERTYGLRVRVDAEGELPLAIAERLTAFRVMRELLINVARHAGTDRASVRLRREGRSIAITVEDGGVGFDPSDPPRGFGLLSVRERVEGLGGRFELDSEKGRGTRARIALPLGDPEDTPAG